MGEPLPVPSPCYPNILPTCLTNSEVQRTFSSTPFPPDPQSTSVPNAPRPVVCLLDTFSQTAPPLIPSTDRLLSCGSLQALPLSDEELEDDGPNTDGQEFSASGENPESVLKESSLCDLTEMPTEDSVEEDSKKSIQNISKRRPSNSNLYGVFSPVMDKKALVGREIGMDDVSMSTAVDDKVSSTCTADAATKVKCFPRLDDVDIEVLFRPFAGKVKASPKVIENEATCGNDGKETENIFSLELSTSKEECSSGADTITGEDELKDRDASNPNIDAVYVEGSSSSDEITNEDGSLCISKEQNLYVHMSYQ